MYLRRFVLALQFLTVVTVRPRLRAEEGDLAGSMGFYPIIGLLLGLGLAWANRLMGFWPPVLADAVTVALGVVLTRGLHLEGLADTSDALGSGITGERALEIMKDSRSGSFAIMAVALDLLLRWAALMALPGSIKFQALVLVPVLSRWAMVYTVYGSTYARKDGEGLAGPFVQGLTKLHMIAAAFSALVISVALLWWIGAALFLGAGLLALAAKLYYFGRLGGITGDLLGALNEVTELILFLALIAWIGLGG